MLLLFRCFFVSVVSVRAYASAVVTKGTMLMNLRPFLPVVVLAHAHVATGMVCGATLTLDDVAGLYNLTAKLLDAESFAF